MTLETDPHTTLWHTLPAGQVLQAMRSEREGLTQKNARKRLQKYGRNRLPAPPKRHPGLRFLAQFHNALIYVLLGASVITAGLGHLSDSAVIFAVVLINAVIGYVQEGRAEKAMDAIRDMLTPRSAVLRGGKRTSVDSSELVPGDIVLLEAGERVPADVRLLETSGLRIDESILTGESVPVDKTTASLPAETLLAERACLAFNGTIITAGVGQGIVTATGMNTEIGRISGMLSAVQPLVTPLVRQMNAFGGWLTLSILLLAAVMLAYGYIVGHMPFAELFMAVVGLSVAAIPEGLPAVLTITLAIGVQVMARHNAVVRRLPAIETIGAVSVICCDKTGTLTRNEMTAVNVVTSSRTYSIEGSGYAPRGTIRIDGRPHNPSTDRDLREVARAAALCNDAALHDDVPVWRVEGDPMEGALLSLAGKIAAEGIAPASGWTRTDCIPFDAAHRYMAVLHHNHQGHARIDVKGAPERVIELCTDERAPGGGIQTLDPDYWHARAEAIAAKGQRVIALATRRVPQDHVILNMRDLSNRLTLIGLVGLIDPPRPEAVAAVGECLRAGIRVKMITGDHASTARAIGRQIGLRNIDDVITGPDLETMDDDALAETVHSTDIFARTGPEHKLRLVMALQAHGLTVAMTGDGVNDAPALKRADAGIAMGQRGSEVAKEAADLVLTDDNFASIAAAVREGRTAYDNIKKVINWTLPTSAGEAMTIVIALLLGLALPVTAVQILWVNLVTTATLGLALAFEPTEERTMRRPPRQRDAPLLNSQLVWQVVFVSVLFVVAVFGVYDHAVKQGHAIELARTMAVNMLVVLEIFHLFFVRNIFGTSLTWRAAQGTQAVWITVAAVSAAQLAVTYLPFLQNVFGTAPMSLADGFLIVTVGVVFFAVVETEKQIRLMFASKHRTKS